MGVFDDEFGNETMLIHTTDFAVRQNGRSTFAIIATTIFTTLMAFTAFVGNAAVVFVTLKFENLRSQMNNFPTVVLSVIDTLTGLTVILPAGISIAVEHWPLGRIACRFHSTFQYTFACGSSNCLAVISLDRAISVMYPLRYPSMMTLRMMLLMCGYACAKAIIIGGIAGGPDWTEWDYWEGMCSCSWDYEGYGVYRILTIGFVFCFFVPAAVVLTSNALIVFSARKSQKSVIVPVGEHGQRLGVTRKNSIWQNKTITSMMVVVAVYYLAFTPFSVSKIIKIAFPDVYVPDWVDTFASLAIFASSATNPFIYAIFRSDYRKAFKKLPRLLRNSLSFK